MLAGLFSWTLIRPNEHMVRGTGASPTAGELLAGIIGASVAASSLIFYAYISRPVHHKYPPDEGNDNSATTEPPDLNIIRSPNKHPERIKLKNNKSLQDLDPDSRTDSITKVVLTGGPCAGKSTAMTRIATDFEALNYKVYIIPEMATFTISSGADPGAMSEPERTQWQGMLMRLQMKVEEEYELMAQRRGGKCIILCDRGVMDSKAYLTEEQWAELIEQNQWNLSEIRDHRYNGIIHLTTTAIGARDFYTTINNEARRESADEAAMVDKRTEQAWVGHENFVIIDNSTDFEEKMIRTIGAISRTLGLPKFGSIRKFLVKPVKKNAINLPYAEYTIVQTKLRNGARLTVKEDAGGDGMQTYMYLGRHQLDDDSFTTVEDLLTPQQYIKFLTQADEAQHVIRKTRRTFVYERQYFMLDEFHEPEAASKFTVLQTKQAHADNEKFAAKESRDITCPTFVDIITDVTHKEIFTTSRKASEP